MKKLLCLLLLCAVLLSCTACGGGDVDEVGILEVESSLYTSAEIGDGVNTVLDYFQKNFDGCTLRELQYIGDEKNTDYLDFATRNGCNEVMVFTSTFDVDESGGNGSLKPNTSYEGWLWFLGRTDGGKWVTLESGY